jgi:serine/threonine protein phosphatase PrpC
VPHPAAHGILFLYGITADEAQPAIFDRLLRGRVLGILAVMRSIGDHGLKEYVIWRPYVSSMIVNIVDREENEDAADDSGCDKYATATNNDDGRDDNIEGMRHCIADHSPPYTDGEFLIVACNGLWDVMSDQEVVDLVRTHHRKGRCVEDDNCDSREDAASFLVEVALRRGSADNITVVVYWL